MSGAAREKNAADYDLERFIEMFDQALTSDDPRVKNALRQLMMMVILTDTDDHEGKIRNKGPLRQMQEDMYSICKKMSRLEEEIHQLQQKTNVLTRYGDYHTTATDAVATWPKEWKGQSWDTYGEAIRGNIPPVTLDDLNIKINSVIGNQLTGKK